MKFYLASIDWNKYRDRMVKLQLIQRSTWNNQHQIVNVLCSEIGEIDIADIRKSQIELYIGKRLHTCAPVTVAGEINVLRQILNWCVDEQHLAVRPRLPSVSVPNVEMDLPPDEAYTFVLKNIPDQHAASLEFMLLTGLSPHELERIQHRDYRIRMADDAVECPLEVQIGMRADFQTKTPARKRTIMLNKRASTILLQMTLGMPDTGLAFPSRESTEKAIQRMRKRHPDAPAGVERITPKMMRQWFASKISGDVAENVLQALLGHAPGSSVTRRHYVRSNEAQRVDAVSNLSISAKDPI